jgi:hypothetical protein
MERSLANARATASICFAMVELELIDRERCVVERRIRQARIAPLLTTSVKLYHFWRCAS